MPTAEPDVERSLAFRQLKWSLQALATSGAAQPSLFPDHAAKADGLASDFAHWAYEVRDSYGGDLTAAQIASLDAIERKLATISRDGAEFDLELWTDAALRTSDHWADVRTLAADAIDAFGWPVEGPDRDPAEPSAEEPVEGGSV